VLLGQRELPAEHPLVKLEQQRLLTGKGPEKRAWRHARGAGDLRGRRALISFFQKQLYGGAQHLLLRQKSARLLAAQQHIDHAPQSLLVSAVT
jgi:hypothetical protein